MILASSPTAPPFELMRKHRADDMTSWILKLILFFTVSHSHAQGWLPEKIDPNLPTHHNDASASSPEWEMAYAKVRAVSRFTFSLNTVVTGEGSGCSTDPVGESHFDHWYAVQTS